PASAGSIGESYPRATPARHLPRLTPWITLRPAKRARVACALPTDSTSWLAHGNSPSVGLHRAGESRSPPVPSRRGEDVAERSWSAERARMRGVRSMNALGRLALALLVRLVLWVSGLVYGAAAQGGGQRIKLKAPLADNPPPAPGVLPKPAVPTGDPQRARE